MRYGIIVILFSMSACNNNSNTTNGEQTLNDTIITEAPLDSANQADEKDLEEAADAFKTLKP